MASEGLREELNCPICLDIYTDPVMLTCGHIFCHICIGNVLDSQEASGTYSCPECRLQFKNRPFLEKNRKLCNIVEHFMSLHVEPDSAVQSEIQVDIPSAPLKNMCSVHHKTLEFYCFNEALCVCADCCFSGRHGGHQVELLEEAVEIKRKALTGVLQVLTSNKAEAEKKLQSLHDSVTEAQEKVSGETERVNALFRDITGQLKHLERTTLEDISRQGEQVVRSASDSMQELEMKTETFSQKIQDLEKTMTVADPLAFLQAEECFKFKEDHLVEDIKKEANKGPNLALAGLNPEKLYKGLENILGEVKSKLSLKEHPGEELRDIKKTDKWTESSPHRSLGQTLDTLRPYSAYTERNIFHQKPPQEPATTPAPSMAQGPPLFFRNPYSLFNKEPQDWFSKIPDITLPKWQS